MRSTRHPSTHGLLGAFLLGCMAVSLLNGLTVSAATVNTPWWANATPLLPPVPKRGSHQATLLPEAPRAPTQSAYTDPASTLINTAQMIEANLAPLPLPPNETMSNAPMSVIGVSQQWIKHTSDQRIAHALSALRYSPSGAPSLETITRLNGKVLFKNLAELDPQYAAYDALAWLDKQNNWMLFINEKHGDAPPEALAALIAHEAMHSDAYNSKQEEAEAWQREARTWLDFQAQHPELKNPALNNIALVKRLNRLGEATHDASLYDLVLQHPSYAHLPRVSPQFSNIESIAKATPSPSTTASTEPSLPQSKKFAGLIPIRPDVIAAASSGLIAPTPTLTHAHTGSNNMLNMIQQRRGFNDIPTVDVSQEPSLQVATAHQYPQVRPNRGQVPQQGKLKGIRLEPMPYRQQPSAAASAFIWQPPR